MCVSVQREISLKTKPTNVFDLILGYLSDKYVHYLPLSHTMTASAAKMLQVLGKGCQKYVDQYHVVPVLFIDGADLLAKCDPLLFLSLIAKAKIMANVNLLSIVFISSEGSIMPLLQQASGG